MVFGDCYFLAYALFKLNIYANLYINNDEIIALMLLKF